MSVDLTLARIRVLFDLLPLYDRPTCHIAGTNGKGSVSAFLSSVFQSSTPPYRVGRYNSPHLVSVYDCITIDDVPVIPAVYTKARSLVEKVNEDNVVGCTSFEILTLTALQIFQDLQVDMAVVEVGMGGRLDATNVISSDCILVSGLTSVDLDHQAFLGNTVEEIAREKAVIARKDRPLVLAPQKYDTVSPVVQEICEDSGAKLTHAVIPTIRPWDTVLDGVQKTPSTLSVQDFVPPEPQPVEVLLPCFSEPLRLLVPLQGEHQLANLGTALTMVSALLTHPYPVHTPLPDFKLRITPDTLRNGIEATVWNGRLSFHKFALPGSGKDIQAAQDVLLLADGAHNPASSYTLSTYITDVLSRVLSTKNSPPATTRTITLTYILGLSHSPPKTPLQTLSPLLPPKLPTKTGLNSIRVNLKVNIALLRFTPPDGMPWVKSVPPSELRSAVSTLCPDANVWTAPDDGTPPNSQLLLSNALEWASSLHVGSDGQVVEGMVVLAGSLYLVADFYRLLEGGHKQAPDSNM